MSTRLLRSPFLVLALAVGAIPAQEAAPKPAAELQKLAPLLGNWQGKGQMSEPSGVVTKWQATGTYQWALDGYFLREDLRIQFDGMPTPMVMHGYLGWDLENQRFLHLLVSSDGRAQLQPLVLGADGARTTMSLQQQGSMHYAERSVFTVKGDTLTHTVDMLLPQGPSMRIVEGTFTRGGDGFAGAFEQGPFLTTTPHADVARLAKCVGVYDVKGAVTMAQGAPAMKIGGVDTFRTVFGGTVVHGHTEGAAEGMPGKYVGEVFWAFDAGTACLRGHYVSNMGEVMSMDARWSADGQLVSTSHSVWMGQPTVQRMLMQFDAAGAAVAAQSHSILGTQAPFESYRATYARRK